MKNYLNTPWKCLASLLVAMTYFFIVGAAKAQTQPTGPVLLTVNINNTDVNDLDDVIITSTGAGASQSVSGSILAGVDLVGLLGPNVTSADLLFGGNALSPTLTTGASGVAGTEQVFNSYGYDDLNGNDLALYYSSTSINNSTNLGMTFVANEPAFESGTSITTDLSGLSLLPVGSYGDIYTGFDGSAPPSSYDTSTETFDTPNELIGEYEVIDDPSLSSAPEPPSWTLAFMVTTLLAVLRFRMRRA